MKDPEAMMRIDKAFRSYRADLLRMEADALDASGSSSSRIFRQRAWLAGLLRR